MIAAVVHKDAGKWWLSIYNVERYRHHGRDGVQYTSTHTEPVKGYVSGLEKAHTVNFDALIFEKPRVSGGLRYTVLVGGAKVHNTSLEMALERALSLGEAA